MSEEKRSTKKINEPFDCPYDQMTVIGNERDTIDLRSIALFSKTSLFSIASVDLSDETAPCSVEKLFRHVFRIFHR